MNSGMVTPALLRKEARMNFSIACLYCDDGQHIDSRKQAEAEGWTEIEDDPDGLTANHLGVCLHCRPKWEADNLPPTRLPDEQ
jgi:hypothetical protein